jgi:DNA-binding response OmpR family regulator
VLRERGVDLIVTDWQMPRLDGPGLARRLRAGGDRTPIIMLSAVDDDRAAADALAAGASCYVVKSLDSRLLSQAVRLALSAAA